MGNVRLNVPVPVTGSNPARSPSEGALSALRTGATAIPQTRAMVIADIFIRIAPKLQRSPSWIAPGAAPIARRSGWNAELPDQAQVRMPRSLSRGRTGVAPFCDRPIGRPRLSRHGGEAGPLVAGRRRPLRPRQRLHDLGRQVLGPDLPVARVAGDPEDRLPGQDALERGGRER